MSGHGIYEYSKDKQIKNKTPFVFQVKNDFDFHPSLQVWVIGKRLAKDTDTLFSHRVSRDGDQAFLFIRSAKAASLSREQQILEERHQRLDGECLL